MQNIDAFVRGDRRELERIYDQLFPSVRSWVKCNSGSSQDAEDIFHDALLVSFVKIKEGYEIQHSLNTFIFSVAKNLWLKKLRSGFRKGDDLREETSSDQDLHQIIEQHEKTALYQYHFDRLSLECQELLKAVFDGMKMSKIASLFKLGSEANARKRKFRCKDHLIKMIEKDRKFKELKHQNRYD